MGNEERRPQAGARAPVPPLDDVAQLTPLATQQMLHSLRVHQVELEMQNEELRRAQVELDAARERYFDLYNLAPVGYCTVSAQGLIVQANLTMAGLLGIGRAALARRPLARFIEREDQDSYYLQRKGLLDDGQVRAFDLRMVRHDGSRFWGHLTISAARDADGAPELRVVLSDISESKRVAQALLEATALQSAIFNSTNFLMIATDVNGLIQMFNVGSERKLGYAAADVEKRLTLLDLADPGEVAARAAALSAEFGTPLAPDMRCLLGKAARGVEDVYELSQVRKDGGLLPVLMSVTALRDARAAIIGYLLIGADNTARKRIEAERARIDRILQDRNVELERAKGVAERANLAKSDFLSSMSHELRTPLNAILGFAQLLEAAAPAPGQRKSIDQILKAGWYLLELINEILDLAVIESGKLSLSMEPVSLTELMDECAMMIEPAAREGGIKVFFPRFDVPGLVWADRIRLKQVLINLLSNAIKYNLPDGTVRVECSAGPAARIRIRVVDTGAGLAADKLAQLFQPFNRLGQEQGARQGTGIGLVVCKRLVELMGGTIGVDSVPGRGSVFWIELACVAACSGAAIAGQPEAAGDAAGQPHTLLYIEDNPANSLLVASIVERLPGCRFLSAVDGASGVELARTRQPDLILMDIDLPGGISGIKARAMLAADPATSHIPVIALSANAMSRDIELGMAAGFFRYLTKPLRIGEFIDTVNLALARVDNDER